jgi:hypothetical protein
LQLKSAYQGNSYWNAYFPGPARGAFVLRIDADKAYELTGFARAISARSQLLVVNSVGIHVAFVDPFYGIQSLEETRRELTNVTFPLELAKGINFLILNYEQQPIWLGGVESALDPDSVDTVTFTNKFPRAHHIQS